MIRRDLKCQKVLEPFIKILKNTDFFNLLPIVILKKTQSRKRKFKKRHTMRQIR